MGIRRISSTQPVMRKGLPPPPHTHTAAASASRRLQQAPRAQRPLAAAQRARGQQVARPQVAAARRVVRYHLRCILSGQAGHRDTCAALDCNFQVRLEHRTPCPCSPAPTCGSVQYSVRMLLRVTTQGGGCCCCCCCCGGGGGCMAT